MVIKAAPAAALKVPKPELLLQLLIVALDAPPQLGQRDQPLKVDVLRQGREPILARLIFSVRPLDQEPFVRARLAALLIAVGRTHPQAVKARGERLGCARTPCHVPPDRL